MFFKPPKNQTLSMFPDWNNNEKVIFAGSAPVIEDVLIKPHRGIVESRSEIVNDLGRFILTAPMDTVTDLAIYTKAIWETDFVMPVLARVYLDDMISYVNYIDDNESNAHILDRGFLSIGVGDSDYSKICSFLDSYFTKNSYVAHPNICIDVAHGWSKKPIDLIQKLRTNYEDRISIMCGSIATSDAAYDLIQCGVDYLRVGLGNGGMCETRLVSGCGVPNLYAIADIFSNLYETVESSTDSTGNFTYKRKIKIIADGGIQFPGDIAKYMVGGASHVMIGTGFASCIDSPAIINSEGFKLHRGQASKEYQLEHIGYVRNGVPEGVERKLKVDQSFVEKANYYLNGLKSTASYVGGNKLSHINPINCKLLRCTSSTQKESKPLEQ